MRTVRSPVGVTLSNAPGAPELGKDPGPPPTGVECQATGSTGQCGRRVVGGRGVSTHAGGGLA